MNFDTNLFLYLSISIPGYIKRHQFIWMFTFWPKSHMKFWHVGYRWYYLVWSLYTSAIPPGAKYWSKSILSYKIFYIHNQVCKILHCKGQWACVKSQAQMRGSFVNTWSLIFRQDKNMIALLFHYFQELWLLTYS